MRSIDLQPATTPAERLHRELWTSWASCLRAYAAVYGLTSTHHAVVEVSADEILLRVDTRWVRFHQDRSQSSEGAYAPFALHDDGTVLVGGVTDEMDLAAERVASSLLAGRSFDV